MSVTVSWTLIVYHERGGLHEGAVTRAELRLLRAQIENLHVDVREIRALQMRRAGSPGSSEAGRIVQSG